MKFFIPFFLLIPFISSGIVDIRSAGYSKTFVDFKATVPGFYLTVDRTYNSRSLFNGLFGFGWCSNFETNLEVLPDNSLKVTECGGGMEVFYYPKNKKADASLQIDLILKEIKKRKTIKSAKSLEQLKKDLIESQTLRADFLRALKIKGKANKGSVYYAKGKSNEYIVFESKGYKRTLPNGLSEVFNNEGQLKRSFDKFGKAIDIFWQPESVRIVNDSGHQVTLVLDPKIKKVKTIKFGNKKVASYKYKNENLIAINNSFGEKFLHSYDKFHNLVKTVYPDKTQEALTYNLDKDWVIGFKNRKNCHEKYTFAKNSKNPNHYFSTVQKKCGRKIVNKSKYEFWNRSLSSGSKYLHRARVVVNGRLKTDVVYHPKFGSPISLLKNGIRTKRFYYANGLLKRKEDPFKIVEYRKYTKKCGKPELVALKYRDSRTKKVVKTENIRIEMTEKCLLSKAFKSDSEWIQIKHNKEGQMVYMEDQSRKSIKIQWHKTLKKPSMITRVGVGSIKIVYDQAGQVVDVTAGNSDSGPTVISQVSSVFNSFLQTLSPVAEEMVIL
ncbi:MAG: DUF6531 domain-containing protein [Bdellovibrionales bacterium]